MRAVKRSARSTGAKPARRTIFAAKVRAARAVVDWSQTEFGKRIPLTQRSVHKIERATVQTRESTEGAIEEIFRKAGLKFEPLADGGFKIVVPAAVLKELERRTK